MPELAELSEDSEDDESFAEAVDELPVESPTPLTVDTTAASTSTATDGLPALDTSATLPTIDTSATLPTQDTSATSPAPATASTPTRTPLSLAELSVASTTGSGTTALGSGRIDVTGRINWWRMYRFPAVTSVPGAAGQRSPTSPSSPSAANPSFPVPTPAASPTLTTMPPAIPGGVSATGPAGTILPIFPAPSAGQPVVPVIVVGLQSVNSAWQQEELANIAAAAGGPEAASAIRRSSIAGSTLASPAGGATSGGVLGRGITSSPSPPVSPIMRPQSPTSPVSPTNTTSTTSTGRRRRERRQWTQEEIEASPFGWPPMDWDEDESDEEEEDEEAEEEAAQRMIDDQQRRREERSAYRSSRATTGSSDLPPPLDSPIEAPASPDAAANNNTNNAATGGARTFLIYVVGGYYPPDHTIVTGGLDNFESFEALLELAEMLGHAKPPTVTKEDIDKSGLETIKPWQLSQYEDEGRVSYNCIERCLICLDDYDEEDHIRIMSCRHAFHKDCVDKWLQTGKNNCPACRSTGVNSP
ncbi:hypothetical protein BKA70DRAFT_1268516 [Coprinopsis sp. MPI-PUGE-AT-0042]|nr:hypothetical protein BKA70DRAFT_1268516 [Coprinopsis sp. MPI-PUGE-AT-0042]